MQGTCYAPCVFFTSYRVKSKTFCATGSPPRLPQESTPYNRDLKIRGRQQQRKHRLKSEFAFIQSSLRQFQLTYFLKFRPPLLELNSLKPYPSSQRERKFRSSLFTSSIQREIRHLTAPEILDSCRVSFFQIFLAHWDS